MLTQKSLVRQRAPFHVHVIRIHNIILLYTHDHVQSVVRLFVILSRRRHQTADTNEGVYNPISDTWNITRYDQEATSTTAWQTSRYGGENARAYSLPTASFFSNPLFKTLYTGITIFTCTIIPHHHHQTRVCSGFSNTRTHTRIPYVLYGV